MPFARKELLPLYFVAVKSETSRLYSLWLQDVKVVIDRIEL